MLYVLWRDDRTVSERLILIPQFHRLSRISSGH